MSRVIVIGGGAAGCMAAVAAAENGQQVTLYEKNEKIGKKLWQGLKRLLRILIAHL